MPPIYIGDRAVTKRYIGSTEVTKVYLGLHDIFGGPPTPVLSDVALIPFGDSRTAIMQYDVAHTQSSNHSFHNWANMLYGQPFEITGNFGIGGQTTVQMQSRITAAIASKKAGKKNFITLLCGVNDIGLLLDSAETIWGRVQAFAEEAMAAGVRPILFVEPGSEAFSASKVTKTLAFNSLMTAWFSTQQMQPIDIRPALFDYASVMWAATPTTAITMKTNYCYDGLHAAVVGSWHGGIAFHNFMLALMGGFNLNIPTGTNMLLNADFATPTGGTVGSGTSGQVPALWRSVRDSSTMTSVVFSTTAEGYPQVDAVAGATNSLAGWKLQQNMVAADFAPGDTVEGWAAVVIKSGAVGLADVSVNVSINYTDSTFETYFEAQSSSGGLNNIPSTVDQTVTVRTRPLTINPAKTISAVTFWIRARWRAEGTGTMVVLPQSYLAKI